MAFELPLDRVRGLRPDAWLVAGRGFSREDLKAELLRERGIVGDAVISLEAIALKLVPRAQGRTLGTLARQDALRSLLSVRAISEHLPELKRLRRQTTFFRRLDQAIQNGRSAFAHSEEADVVSERLEQAFGANPVRSETRILTGAYESWLEGMQLWDLPKLLSDAIRVLDSGWPQGVAAPKAIYHYSVSSSEGLEQAFFEALSRHCEIVPGWTPDEAPITAELQWHLWHTVDDAAESLAETLSQSERWDEDIVLIPDGSEVRRSLRRALTRHHVPLADPRDPTRLRWDERIKWALLPLEVVARGFERTKVLSFLRTHESSQNFPLWSEEIQARGLRQGLSEYRGGVLSVVYDRLAGLQRTYGGKKTAAELAFAHQAWLAEAVSSRPEFAWLTTFFEQVWEDLIADQKLLGLDAKKAPVLFWWERFRERVDQAPSPVERVRPEVGIRSYRAHQLPVRAARRVFILGIPSQFLTTDAPGDYWLSARDRELLSGEFAIRSSFQARKERLESLRVWLGQAEEVIFLDAEHDQAGKERESAEPFLRELENELGAKFPGEPEQRGCHARWLPSFSAVRAVSPREVKLPPIQGIEGAAPEISATALEHYSRCSFMALGMSRWRLRDSKEPSAELWPEVRGQILHEAARTLVSSRNELGQFTVSIEEALEFAWKKAPPRGLLRGKRTEAYVRGRLLRILSAFVEKEAVYTRKSGAKVLSLEEEGSFKLSLPEESPDLVIKGTPDRIDELEDGIFVIDYKTSSSPAPHGLEMIEQGYRLQMPIYALAAARRTRKPVIGLQFVELNRKAGRSSGIFFPPYNGAEAGKPTQVRSSSKSLISSTPEETWQRLGEQILTHGRAYIRGDFKASPKRKRKECDGCMMRDLCGDRRVVADEVEESGDV